VPIQRRFIISLIAQHPKDAPAPLLAIVSEFLFFGGQSVLEPTASVLSAASRDLDQIESQVLYQSRWKPAWGLHITNGIWDDEEIARSIMPSVQGHAECEAFQNCLLHFLKRGTGAAVPQVEQPLAAPEDLGYERLRDEAELFEAVKLLVEGFDPKPVMDLAEESKQKFADEEGYHNAFQAEAWHRLWINLSGEGRPWDAGGKRRFKRNPRLNVACCPWMLRPAANFDQHREASAVRDTGKAPQRPQRRTFAIDLDEQDEVNPQGDGKAFRCSCFHIKMRREHPSEFAVSPQSIRLGRKAWKTDDLY
jgi:hypothetical protein